MEPSNTKRIMIYPAAAALVGALTWYGIVREVDAEPGTLLGCAATQMSLASNIGSGSGGDARAIRDRLLVEAEDYIDRAERELGAEHPGVVVARADLHTVRGDQEGALRLYDTLLDEGELAVAGEALLRQRRAEIYLDLGRPVDALAEVRQLRGLNQSQFEIECDILEVKALDRAGRQTEAIALANKMATAGDADMSTSAGSLLESFGQFEAAESAYRRDWLAPAVSEYLTARLKVQQGELDTAIELLTRAASHDRAEVLARMRQDHAHWRVCAEDVRFRSLMSAEAAAPR